MANLYIEGIDAEAYRILKMKAVKDSLTLKAVVMKLLALYVSGKVKLV